MALSLIGPPRSPALSNDPNWAVFQTNLPTASTRPGFLVSGLAADADVLNLLWGDTLVRMTFATTPDNSGLQLRAASGQTAVEFRSQLAEGLFSVPAIEAAFIITEEDGGVRLTLRGATDGTLQATSSGVSVTIFGGDQDDSFPNLSAAVNVYLVGDPNPLVRLKPGYDFRGATEVPVANIIPAEVGLPNTNTLGPTPVYAADTPAGFVEYYFLYADQYGRPAQPEKLTKSPTYAVVGGGSAGDSPRQWGSSGNLQLCHTYFDGKGKLFGKPIAHTQPDWVYFFVGTSASSSVQLTVTFTDGTTASRQVLGTTSFGRGLHCLPSGPLQCRIDQVGGYDEKEALRYRFDLPNIGFSVTYDLLPDCEPWETFLAFDNGAGGIESVAFHGKTELSYRASAEEFRRARTRVRRTDEGEVVRYQREGSREIRLFTGYRPKAYIEHLRQLLLGRVWLIDQRSRRFVAVLVSNSASLTTEDDDLHALDLTITYATPDRGAHYL